MIKGKLLSRLRSVIVGSVKQFDQHNGPVMAAGMSFFGILSLIPLTLLAISAMGYILGSSESSQQFVYKLLLENFPKEAAEVLERVNSIIATPNRNLVNWLGLIGLIWSGMRFFNMLQAVLNKIWVLETRRRFLLGRFGRFLWKKLGNMVWNKITAFVTFGVAGLLFWFSFLLNSLIAAVSQMDISIAGIKLGEFEIVWLALGFVLSFGISVSMILLVYVLVPRVRVSLRAAFIGAVSAAFLIQTLRSVFSYIVVRFNMYGNIYGPMASVIVFLSWLYFAMNILLFGAEMGSQFQQEFFRPVEDAADEMEK